MRCKEEALLLQVRFVFLSVRYVWRSLHVFDLLMQAPVHRQRKNLNSFITIGCVMASLTLHRALVNVAVRTAETGRKLRSVQLPNL